MSQSIEKTVFEIDDAILGEDNADDAVLVDLLVFEVNGNRFAFENRGIVEILNMRAITPVPFTRDFVLGLINVRGEIVSCIDAGILFLSERTATGERSRIIIIANREISTGLVVSAVKGIEQVPERNIDKEPEKLKGPLAEFIKWIVVAGSGSIAVLDVQHILTSQRFQSYEKE